MTRNEASTAAKNEHVLRAIRDRVKAGDVESRFTNRAAYVWRVQKQSEVERVLMSMVPFLTIWRETAYEAINRFTLRRATVDRVKQRNRRS